MKNEIKYKKSTIIIGIFITIALAIAIILCTYDCDNIIRELKESAGESGNAWNGLGVGIVAMIIITLTLILVIGDLIIVLITTPFSFLNFKKADNKIIKYMNLGYGVTGSLIFVLCVVKILLIIF